MVNIHLAYIHFSAPLPSDVFECYWRQLPEGIRESNARYTRWQDRHNHLFGKILLKNFLIKEYNFGDNALNLLSYEKFDRPYIKDCNIDFNISHTGSVVACAIVESARVGLDIEQCVPIDKSAFADIHSADQWKVINNADDPLLSFFRYWTIKESLIKADGRGLAIPLNQIGVTGEFAYYAGVTWHLKRLELCDTTLACIATNRADGRIILRHVDEKNLYEGVI